MARWFRVINVSTHCGLPIVIASILLCIISSASQCYALYFLPEGAAIPLMIAAGAAGLVGVLAALTGFQILTILYIIAGSLLQIPVFVVIGFTSYTLAAYHQQCFNCRVFTYYGNYCNLSSYLQWLCKMDQGLLWSAISVAFVACLFIGQAIQSFRKLRLYQKGDRTIIQEGDRRGHHHHHHHACVQPTQTVYTVPATTVVTSSTAQPIFVQQQTPAVYPVIPPPAYSYATDQPVATAQIGTTGTVQQVNYNPPRNPDF